MRFSQCTPLAEVCRCRHGRPGVRGDELLVLDGRLFSPRFNQPSMNSTIGRARRHEATRRASTEDDEPANRTAPRSPFTMGGSLNAPAAARSC